MKNDWLKRPNGDLALAPVVGWEAMTGPMLAALQLHYSETPEQLQKGQFARLQVGMTVPQCRELSQLLARMADQIEAQPLGTAQ